MTCIEFRILSYTDYYCAYNGCMRWDVLSPAYKSDNVQPPPQTPHSYIPPLALTQKIGIQH